MRSSTLFLFLCLIAFNSVSAASLENSHYSRVDYGEVLSFVSGINSQIQIPLSELEGARIMPGLGLLVAFEDRSYFSFDVVTSDDMDYRGLDIRGWPLYLFGLKDKGDEPAGYIQELLLTKEEIIDTEISPFAIRVFDTSSGKGYWAVGNESSFLVLVYNEQPEQISVIKTEGISEERIEKLIINGVL